MKFVCDRCKTRYSIADERVRGKILKIRCKNCSNVITVREGMPAPEAESAEQAEARRQLRPTDYAPAIVGPEVPRRGGATPGKSQPEISRSPDGSRNALQAAFAQSMVGSAAAAPPPALEEEWYVSLDGEQAGPFRLAEAQAWVKGKRAEDELFCWCEGFDDWLAVEKVSHFRGLRAPAPKKAPPRPPAPAGRPQPSAPAEDPKPLFAAALAALEADVARTEQPPPPVFTPGVVGAEEPRRGPSKPVLAKATPLTGTPAAFDQFDASPSEVVPERPKAASRTIPLSELAKPVAPAPTPAAAPRNGHPAPLNATVPLELIDDSVLDGDFAIGEVSRVVRLADIAAGPRKTAPAPAARRVAAAPARAELAEAALPASPLAQAASASLHDETVGAPPPEGPYAAPVPLVPAAKAQAKRPYAILAAGAGALVLVIGLIVFFATRDDDQGANRIGGSGGDVSGLGLAIDDPRTHSVGKASATGSDDQTDPITHQPRVHRPTNGTGTQTPAGSGTGASSSSGKSEVVLGPDGLPLEPLTPDDVVAVAQRTAAGTTERCYNRALKQNPYLTVKSAGVVITVGADGKVSDAAVDPVGDDNLHTCLVTVIKKWTFRRSTAGISTKLTLKFGQEMP